ncbi:MAG TPA: methyltransferase domain-containing protein [Marmoricola sp.]|jgi:SAM-dependent methyltransferase|nr:methyltransferase domain-containing protein [Marmoricola sp.]
MERPLERRAASRTAVVWDTVQQVLAAPGAFRAQGARIADIGGGTGGFAVRLAGQGHRVDVIDPSPDALAALDRRAQESGVPDLVTGHQGDLADLPELLEDVDLVLCHGVLGVVDDPAAAVAALAGVLRPGGVLSLLVSQRHAAVLHRAMAGSFADARALLTGDPEGAERRFTAPELVALLTGAGFGDVRTQGVRVFADLVPSPVLDTEPGAIEGLLDLERAVADRPEFLALATQLHSLATR